MHEGVFILVQSCTVLHSQIRILTMASSLLKSSHDLPISMKVPFEKKKSIVALERLFGGLNVATSGDAWQFGPIASSAVYDNPRSLPKKASIETIGAMFWKHEGDSFNCFKELTVERRCKDPWL